MWDKLLGIGMSVLQQTAGAQQQRAQLDAARKQQEMQNQMLWRQQQQQEKSQRDLLKRQMASNRAALASGGLSSSNGSGAALMAGLQARTAQNIADGYEDTALQHKLRNPDSIQPGAAENTLYRINKAKELYGVMSPLFTL